MTYCWNLDLSSPSSWRTCARTSSVHARQRMAVVASPGAARKITKFSVAATKIVAKANRMRRTTYSVLRTRGLAGLLQVQPGELGGGVQDRRRDARPALAEGVHQLQLRELDVGLVAVEDLLHLPDDLLPLLGIERDALLLVELVVGRVAVGRVAPAAVLVAADHGEDVVGVEVAEP